MKKNSRLSLILNHKISVVFSIISILLGAFLYLISDLVVKYICSDFLYSKTFGECSDSYEYYNLIVAIVLNLTGLIFVFSALRKDRYYYWLYIKLFSPFITFGLFLSWLSWNNSSGGFFNINFGPIFLVLTFLITIVIVLSIAWSNVFYPRLYSFIFISFFLLIAVFNQESIYKYTENLLFGNLNDSNSCSDLRLFREQDRCYFSKAIHEDNLEVCNLISARSPDEKIDCLDFIYRNRGTGSGDKKWCNYISSDYQKSLCYK